MEILTQPFIDSVLLGGGTLCILAACYLFVISAMKVVNEHFGDHTRSGRGLLADMATVMIGPAFLGTAGTVLLLVPSLT